MLPGEPNEAVLVAVACSGAMGESGLEFVPDDAGEKAAVGVKAVVALIMTAAAVAAKRNIFSDRTIFPFRYVVESR